MHPNCSWWVGCTQADTTRLGTLDMIWRFFRESTATKIKIVHRYGEAKFATDWFHPVCTFDILVPHLVRGLSLERYPSIHARSETDWSTEKDSPPPTRKYRRSTPSVLRNGFDSISSVCYVWFFVGKSRISWLENARMAYQRRRTTGLLVEQSILDYSHD